MRLLAVLILAARMLSAQETGMIEGQVLNAASNEPVRKATVMVRNQSATRGTSYLARTDASGKFVVPNVEPGTYSVDAEHDGYSEKRDTRVPASIKIAAGGHVSDLVLRLVPTGAITGRVVDPDGDPVRNGTVQAMRLAYFNGRRQLNPAANVPTGNDGEYRLFELTPGTYYVIAAANTRGMMGGLKSGRGVVMQVNGAQVATRTSEMPPTYFPGVTDGTQATALKVGPGSEVGRIDIALRNERVYSVAGKFPTEPLPTVSYVAQIAEVRRDGGNENYRGFGQWRLGSEFRFDGLPDGSYLIFATRTEGEQQSYAQKTVEVAGADVVGLDLDFRPVVEVKGTIRFESGSTGGTVPVEKRFPRMTLMPEGRIGMYIGQAQVKPDGTFVIAKVPPMALDFSVIPAPGVYLKSVWLGEKELPGLRVDLSDAGGRSVALTLVMGTDVGDLAGTVQGRDGKPAGLVNVTAVPVGKHLGRADLTRSGMSREDGRYDLKRLAPGEYRVYAWEDWPDGAYLDAEFLKPYEGMGVTVKLEANGKAEAALTMVAGEK